MEANSKPKVTIPLVAAIPIPYTTIPINLFQGRVDKSARTSIKSNRTQPYSAVGNHQRQSLDKKSCTNCTHQRQKETNNQTSNNGQSTTSLQMSNMYSGSPMLILPFVSAKPNQSQQKSLPNLYIQQSLAVLHAKKPEDSTSMQTINVSQAQQQSEQVTWNNCNRCSTDQQQSCGNEATSKSEITK
ncbi:CLUMA_CG008256, isoform A [Clunio marinus]|uniref:CLUMA_CG008256, isoform A n=1 Tax=Clunio marinus TaxID=568069 RepID=A0A1J1I4S5_9DIPT|nr:CLUMA_CG008256, isoform A [Clunio marinus]